MGLANCALVLWLVASPTSDPDGALRNLAAEHPQRASVEIVGHSSEGRPILALRIGPSTATDAGSMVAAPALLIVAGMDARLTASTDIALGVARSLLTGESAATTYLVPAANPDARARVDRGEQPAGVPGSLAPHDDDFDGRMDEDPPADVNGDGKVTWMRVFDPPAGTPRTHLADPEDGRLSREADPTLGERATFAWMREGFDADGDGRYAEDGRGSVSLDRNFPARFPEHGRDSGPFPLSEPESKALVDWLLTKDDIAAALVLGSDDNLFHAPAAGKNDVTGRAPLGVESGDAPYHKYVKHLYDELINREDVSASGTPDGALATWLYGHFGVPTFAADITRSAADSDVKDDSKNDDAKNDDAKKDDAKKDDANKDESRPVSPPKRSRPDAEKGELAWLADATRTTDETFDAFEEAQHPTLGRVEIGGPLEDARLNPTPALVSDLSARYGRFAAALLERLPRLALAEPRATALGGGVYRVTFQVTNEALLPTSSEIGMKTRRALPVTMRLEGPAESIVSGDRIQRASAVSGSGGDFTAEWMLIGAEGQQVEITVRGSNITEHVRAVTLPPARPAGGNDR